MIYLLWIVSTGHLPITFLLVRVVVVLVIS
jgi:hypothetical protein